MIFQLRLDSNKEIQAIEILFGRHFVLPVVALIMLIVGLSAQMVSDGKYSQVIYPADPIVINRLQRQVANMEAESQRLREFAKKVVDLAKLDKDVFDFDKPPARGGLGGRNIFQHSTSVTIELIQDIDILKKQFIDQSNQLERMQLILKSRIMGESEKRPSWPVTKGYLSSTFGVRKDPFTGRLRRHRGIDLAGKRGSDIMSIASGEVIFSGRKGGYGRIVEIKHANGLVSRYAHLEASLVQEGQVVAIGEKIAKLGSSGRSTGPHLHLEILENNKNIDPLVFLRSNK